MVDCVIRVKMTRKENASFFGMNVGDVIDVELETYVATVVASEIGNADLEACKAQAVAARTFAVRKGVLDGKTITDSSLSDQAYRIDRYDHSKYSNAMAGTEATNGEIIVYNGKPIDAVYSASNGGRTVSSESRWGGARAYLIEQDDPWDNSSKRTGHGVGMSQRGAKAMAAAGKSYREILSFYYPGTDVKSINQPEVNIVMVKVKDFIDKVLTPLVQGWGYIYGTKGKMWTREDQAKLNQTTDSNRAKSRTYGSKWIGRMVTDCAGLINWAMAQFGITVAHHATYLYTDYCDAKGRYTGAETLKPGTLVFKKGSHDKIHHVGVYIGDNTVVEAKGAEFGVVTSALTDGWDYWGELKAVDYFNNETTEVQGYMQTALVNNPNSNLNMRRGPGSTYSIIAKIPKGSTVEVIDTSIAGWYQIKYGGCIGYASAKYLQLSADTPVEPMANEAPSVPSTADIIAVIRAQLNGIEDMLHRLEQTVNQLK